jgi:cysteinyl-tRNA synthetase
VYFDTSKLKRYYIFNEHKEEDLAVGVREGVEEDTNKRNKNDFVLWFTKSKFEDQALKWDSPWGTGYPGWHIECSGISMKYLGRIWTSTAAASTTPSPTTPTRSPSPRAIWATTGATGGSTSCTSTPADGKMSKSKGEFLTVSLLEEKGYDPHGLPLFCLQSHYRKVLVFSYENLDNAKVAYEKLIARRSRRWTPATRRRRTRRPWRSCGRSSRRGWTTTWPRPRR